MAQLNYDLEESRRFRADLRQADEGSDAEKLAAQIELLTRAQTDRAYFGQRTHWLLSGCYGYGSQQAAWRDVCQPNFVEFVWCTLAALDFACPRNLAENAWCSLSQEEREAIALEIGANAGAYVKQQAVEAAYQQPTTQEARRALA